MQRPLKQFIERDTEAPRVAREFVSELLTANGNDDMVADAELVTSELVTNAVSHADGPSLQLSVQCADDHVRIEVVDDNTDAPVRRHGQPTSIGGLGLVVVDRLAERWGVEPHSRGKRVWCVLPFGAP